METHKLSPPPFLLIVLLFLLSSIATAHRLNNELSTAISALRSHGYNIFPNAIAESHLHLRLLLLSRDSSTLTLFSPPDSFPFSPPDSLFRFVSPFRLPASRLQILSHGTSLNTLLPHHHLLVQRTKILMGNGTVSESVTVDGMRVSLPDIFIGSSIAVHGLDEVLVEVLPMDELVTGYVSRWTETSLLRSKNGTNGAEIEMLEEEGLF